MKKKEKTTLPGQVTLADIEGKKDAWPVAKPLHDELLPILRKYAIRDAILIVTGYNRKEDTAAAFAVDFGNQLVNTASLIDQSRARRLELSAVFDPLA